MSPSIIYLATGLVVGFVFGAAWMSRSGKGFGATSKSKLNKNRDEGTDDPVTDADRQMALGEYGDAFAMIESAITEEPLRTDLKLKALEILFIWGNSEKFLAYAIKFQRYLQTPGDWNRVCVMGAEICPDERLFESAS